MISGLKIQELSDAIRVKKENGTEVYYYIFDEYEIHLNKILPGSIQEWHFHSEIEETIVVTKGKLRCRWIENDMEKDSCIESGELVRVGNSIHTFENDTDDVAEFIVFRFVPDGLDKKECIKRDKTVVKR